MAQPFLLVEAEAREHALDAFAARLRGPSCCVRVASAGHFDFTDVPRISPLLQYLSSRGEKSEGAADTAHDTNQVVTAFFDATLRGDEAGWSRVRSARPRFSTACERGPVWWSDGAPDYNRHLVANSPYADWYEAIATDPPGPEIDLRRGRTKR